MEVILPVSGNLEKGSFQPHPIHFFPPFPMPAHHRPSWEETIFSSPSCHSDGNAEFSPWQRKAATKTKDNFHPEATPQTLPPTSPGPCHYFFSPLWAGSKLQAHALGRLSCGQCNLLRAAEPNCTLALAFDLPRQNYSSLNRQEIGVWNLIAINTDIISSA